MPGTAAAAGYTEGVQYERVVPPQPTSSGDKVEVLELFWYGCPHCFRLEPALQRWLENMPKNAEYVRMPAILRASWEPHARAYYVAQLLGVEDKIHAPLFDAMHRERRRLDSETALEAFFAEHRVKPEDFRKAYRSFAVESKIRRARIMGERYGIHGVPTIIVNGKYRTNATLADGNENMMKVVDYLIAKESSSGSGAKGRDPK